MALGKEGMARAFIAPRRCNFKWVGVAGTLSSMRLAVPWPLGLFEFPFAKDFFLPAISSLADALLPARRWVLGARQGNNFLVNQFERD
jgi:hypothetical protein